MRIEIEKKGEKRRRERHVDEVGKQGRLLFNSSMMIYLEGNILTGKWTCRLAIVPLGDAIYA